ncbi:MAG: CDP-diacylglycerol--glycerol-3-phosphate 3-phosphatidyltransferase [Mogibacterium sp.]|nr:CDP-diacylglycerol--glycerol-3-phosphate 3-phosphatidyltransferase [Mogibacterium sp.]
MNLPNKLTIARVIAVPFFIIAFLMSKYWIALVLFCAASVTDFFDGKIARERGLVTNFGKIMDPLADKILVYSALCLFIEADIIAAWMLIVILAREFVIAGMRTVAASEGRVLAAGMSGKIKTVLQMFAVIVLLLALAMKDSSVSMTIMLAGNILFWASLVMTVYSGCEYVLRNKDVFSM